MKQEKVRILRKVCLGAGAVCIVSAMVLLIAWQWNIHASEQRSADLVRTISGLLPEIQSAVPEERRDNTMPILSLDGVDFVGILELPRYGAAFPVGDDWGKVSQYPCRFSGSVYDRTIQIGATTQKGQFDFYREISVGDTVFFTDAEGNRYLYEVTDLRYEQHADQEALHRKEGALTLFIKNEYAFEYLIVFCNPVT